MALRLNTIFFFGSVFVFSQHSLADVAKLEKSSTTNPEIKEMRTSKEILGGMKEDNSRNGKGLKHFEMNKPIGVQQMDMVYSQEITFPSKQNRPLISTPFLQSKVKLFYSLYVDLIDKVA